MFASSTARLHVTIAFALASLGATGGDFRPPTTRPRSSEVVVRWRDRREVPLTVWIQPRPKAAEDSSMISGVRDAFAAWEDIGVPVSFRFVDDSAAAEVHVSWVDRFRERISGKTVWVYDGDGWIVEANIRLALRHRDGEPLDARATRALSLHEVGHLLGLAHSETPTSIMAPIVRVERLTDEDATAARALYARLPDVRGSRLVARVGR